MSELSTTAFAMSSMSIHPLSHDILIYIFTLNADMFSDKHTLHTTRITSQVCHEWRNLLLGASFLWARLIDLDLLHDDWFHVWRNELILRSRAAPLWIKLESDGNLHREPSGPPPIIVRVESIAHFIFRITSDNWHRIQKLVLKGKYWNVNITISTLRSPAPYMQTLVIPIETMIVQTKESGENNSLTSIFADHAPFLRILSLRENTGIFNYQASWLCQLHTLHLDGEYDVHDVLSVLSATHNLRELRLILDDNSDTTLPIPTVYLPRLQCLQLRSDIPHHDATFLNHIEIPIDCLLVIYSDYSSRSQISPTDYLPLIDAFSRYARRHLQSHQSNTLSLDYVGYCQISWKCSTFSPVKCSEVGILIFLGESIVPRVFEIILKTLACPELSSVTTVKFCGWEKRTLSCLASFKDFFEGLTSLHTMYSDDNTLERLTELQEDTESAGRPSAILPSLSTVYLHLLRSSVFLIPVRREAAAFFLSRLRYGYPVSNVNLRLRHCDAFDTPPNMDALKKVSGLKVTYIDKPTGKIYEYICGRGCEVQE